MRIDIITVLPEMLEGFFNCSIMKRAQNKGLAEIHIHNLRDYTNDNHRRVDDYPFGGFAGNHFYYARWRTVFSAYGQCIVAGSKSNHSLRSFQRN